MTDNELRKMWWIASFPKSGNTFVRMFVNAYVTGFPVDINANFQYSTNDSRVQMYQTVASVPIADMHPFEIAYLRPSALMNAIQSVAPRDVCLKTHHANVDIDGIPLIPPRLTKQAVYLVRDPRDVAVSYTRHSGGTIDKTIAVMANNNHAPSRGNGLVDYCLSWSSHVHSWMNCKFPVKMVRYEEMITDKHDAFRKIMIGLGYRDVDEERLQFAIDQTSLANLRRLEEKEGFRESKHDTFFGQPDASSDDVERIGQWKDILTTEQVEKIESDHGKIMVKLGYDLSLVTV